MNNKIIAAILTALVLAYGGYEWYGGEEPIYPGAPGDTWCGSGWDKRIYISVNNTGGSVLTDYQVYVNLSSNPINETSLRVYNSTSCTLRPHWTENETGGNSYGVWINYSSIAASSWSNNTAIYYDNAIVSSTGNGDDTFEFFDGFELEESEGDMWGNIVHDSEFAYDGFMSIKDGAIYLTPYYDDGTSTKTNYARPFLLYSVFLYETTGNQTYLNTAQQTADDMDTYAMNQTTKIVADWDWQNDQKLTSAVSENNMAGYLAAMAIIASHNSSYLPIANKTRDGIINNFINSNNLTYNSVHPDGTVSDNSHYLPGANSIIVSLLMMYEFHNDTTARDKALDIINATWDLRNPTTNLIAEKFNADTKAKLQNNFRMYDAAGTFLYAMEYAYYLTNNTTIKQHIIDYSYATAYYQFDAGVGTHGAIRYRTNDDGTSSSNIYELCFKQSVDGLLRANDINANTTVYNNAKNTYDTLLTDGLIVSNNLVKHAVYSDGSDYSSHQSLFDCNWQLPITAYKLYLETGNSTYLTTAKTHYNQLIAKHKRTTVKGYVRAIDPYSFANAGYDDKLSADGLYFSSGAILLVIKPSSGVSVKWWEDYEYPSAPLNYMPSVYFNKVHFDWTNKKITLDNVTGAGTIDFDVKSIVSAKKDGAVYTDFTGTTLTTVAGTHFYEVVVTSEHRIEANLDTDKWENLGTGSGSISGGIATVSASSPSDGIVTKNNISLHNFILEFKMKPETDVDSYQGVHSPYIDTSNIDWVYIQKDGSTWYDAVYHYDPVNGHDTHWEYGEARASQFYDYKIVRNGSEGSRTIILYENDIEIIQNAFNDTGWGYGKLALVATPSADYDNVRVRKYASTEATSTLGSEEEQSGGTTPVISNVTNGSVSATSQWIDWDVNQTAHNRVVYDKGSVGADSTACVGDWDVNHACANASDGDWSSYAASAGAMLAYAYFNYTVPTSASQSESLWHVKDSPGHANLTIPSACWGGTLYLRAMGNDIGNSITWQCDNGPGWTTLHTSVANIAYEQEMKFKYVSSWDNSTGAPNITLSGLIASTLYEYQVWSYNTSNTSLSDNSSTLNFTTATAESTPVISNVTNGSINSTAQWIDWDVNQTAHNRVKWSNESDLTPTYWSSWENSTNAPNITLSGLAASTQYWYQAWSYNTTNTSLSDNSSTLNFTTAAAANYITITGGNRALFCNWSSNTTFANIAANLTNCTDFFCYNSSSQKWIFYNVNRTINANTVIHKHAAIFVCFNNTTTVDCEVLAAETITIPSNIWYYTALRESTSKTLTEINTAITADGCTITDSYAWNSPAGAYTNTGSYSVLPNEGFDIYCSVGCSWDGSV